MTVVKITRLDRFSAGAEGELHEEGKNNDTQDDARQGAGDWIKKPGVAIVSCNDGLRPVIMKLEATDEESKIDYHPIER